MGRQAYAIGGGILGAAVAFWATGGTGTLQGYEAGFAIGAALGGVAGSYIDPILLQGNKVGDNQIQVAAEGGARAMVYGRACVSATCIIARGNRKVTKQKTSNGKGSSGSTVNETVTWTFAIGLSEAIPGSSICRIWQDEKLVYDTLGDGTISFSDNQKFQAKFRYYDGAETQLPDADLQTFLGVDDTPYFRGTAYVVFPNFDLTQTGERIPIFKFEILDGVGGLVDETVTLEWDFPTAGPGEPVEITRSQTLTAPADVTLNAVMKFTGTMETRPYAFKLTDQGGEGHFITTLSDGHDVLTYGYVSYAYVEVSNPFKRVYLNYAGSPDASPGVVTMDGGNNYQLTMPVKGNATITLYVNNEDGVLQFPGETCTMVATITGEVPIGDDKIALSTIADDIMFKAGLTSDQFDTSALDNQVAGVCIESTVTGGEALNACIQPFFADPCERDGVLSWVKRGAAVVRTLTVQDLTEEPDSPSRENVIEYPANLSFFYQSPATGYATTKATSRRYSPQADSSGEGSVTAPITFYDPDEPAQIAAKLHKVMWTEAEGSFAWSVGIECLDLIPTDVVGLLLRGIVTRARIIASEFDGNTVKLSLIKDRQSSYTSNVTAIPLPAPTVPLPTTMSKAVLAVLDIPALTDSDDQLCYYTAVSGSTSVWSGAQLQRSLDDGATWTPIGEVTRDVTMGRLTAVTAAADAGYTDTTNTVTVQLFDSANELVSISDAAFLQEQGAIAVQFSDGTWEIMQYRDAVDGGSGLYTLSYLQRGRLNTAAASHGIGALFVLLADGVVKNSAQSAWIGAVIKHRAVSYGESSEDADVVSVTYEGLSQREWSPASATAEYDGTYVFVDDIVARDRFGTDDNPIASVNFQGFRVIITDGTNTVTADIADSDSAHVLSAPITTPTGVTIAGLNKITGAGNSLSVVPTGVPAGSLTAEAVVNGGGA